MTYDQIIVGGGLYGCAVAYHLARRGRSVLVLEARTVASGASGGLGKRGVRGNRRDVRELPLLQRAYGMWPALSELLGADVGYERTGGVSLIENEVTGFSGGLVAAEAHARAQSAHGVPTHVIGRDAVADLLPGVSDLVRAALHCPLDGMADHTATTRAYADAARRLGAVVVEDAPVQALERVDGVVRAVVCQDGTRYATTGSVLLANNTGAGPLVERELGVQLPVWPVYPQVLRLRPVGESPVPLLVGHDHRRLSLKTIEDGVVMASGGWRGRRSDDHDGGVTMPDDVAGNLREAVVVFPSLAEATLLEADASRSEACAQDQVPVVDVLPGAGNLVVATGWTGHGFAIAPAVAEVLAAWLDTGTRPAVLAPFELRRFGTPGRLVGAR